MTVREKMFKIRKSHRLFVVLNNAVKFERIEWDNVTYIKAYFIDFSTIEMRFYHD